MAKGWTISQVFVRTWMDRRTNQTVATPEERGRYKKSSKISLSKEGIQGPRTQVPDFREAKHRYLQLYIEHVERTGEGNSPIHLAQKQDIIVNNLKVSRSTTTQLIPELDGDCTLQSVYWKQHDNWKSNQSWDSWWSWPWTEQKKILCRKVLWQKLDINDLNKQSYDIDYRAKVDVTKSANTRFCTGEPVAKVISTPFFLVQVVVLPETFNSLATDWRCKQVHLSHVVFEHAQQFTDCLHSFAQCTWHAWLKPKIVFHAKGVVPSLAPCLTPWHTEHAAHLPHIFLLFLVLYHRDGWSHP